jgi:hypothetical protein
MTRLRFALLTLALTVASGLSLQAALQQDNEEQ